MAIQLSSRTAGQALREKASRRSLWFAAARPGRSLKMSPRPRETSDEEILAAAARVMQRRSPAELTLADVAREAGVVPATLIQRFGTKRGLLRSEEHTSELQSPYDL